MRVIVVLYYQYKSELEVSGWTSLKVGEIRAGSFAELF